MENAKEHGDHDPVYAITPDTEKIMRRFLADLTSSSHSFLFVAILDEETIGFISGDLREGSPAFHPKTWASVDDVYVAPEYRSLGVGRALLSNVEAWSREKGANGISLQVAAANERARNFYDRLGFREVSIYEVLEFE
ncbi:GNAT family N-acetyltransferase [soil metagenome]